MMLFWKIRYLDRNDTQFKDRYLYLNTKTLDAVTRASVELLAESRSSRTEREILKYKRLFVEGTVDGVPGDSPSNWDKFKTVCPSEYFEDETGKEISADEIGRILTGNSTARAIPHGARQHDIDFMFAEPKPVPLAEVSLSLEEIRLLGVFVRDYREMQDSAFMKDPPGTLKLSGSPLITAGSNPVLETPANDDEIRSFVMIFRRLYMTSDRDPANFLRVVPFFVRALAGHPYAKWVEGTAKEYENHLAAVPDARPFVPPGTCTFTTKRLIDVFLYTRYAHQPDERRQQQFDECLAQVQGERDLLKWMFLTEMWRCSLAIRSAGKVISGWFKHYCNHHGVSADVPKPLREEHSGIGGAEKEEHRQNRLFEEKVQQLALELWEQAGSPQGGSAQFLATARQKLTDEIRS
jgi:hypothetical protein